MALASLDLNAELYLSNTMVTATFAAAVSTGTILVLDWHAVIIITATSIK
jgi:hypothetical protein